MPPLENFKIFDDVSALFYCSTGGGLGLYPIENYASKDTCKCIFQRKSLTIILF